MILIHPSAINYHVRLLLSKFCRLWGIANHLNATLHTCIHAVMQKAEKNQIFYIIPGWRYRDGIFCVVLCPKVIYLYGLCSCISCLFWTFRKQRWQRSFYIMWLMWILTRFLTRRGWDVFFYYNKFSIFRYVGITVPSCFSNISLPN